MTRPELPKCRCGKRLTARDVQRGYQTCSTQCALSEQSRRIDALRADEPSDDEVLDGLLALKREDEAKRGGR